MARATSIFIFLCMGVIAASVAAIMMFQFSRPVGEALTLGLSLLCTMIVMHLVFARQRDRGDMAEKVAALEERVLEVDEDVSNIEGRLTGMETNLPRRTREEIDPLFAEVEVLGSLIKQMAEAMAGMEDRIDEQDARQIAPPPPQERFAAYEEPRALGYSQQPSTHSPHPGQAPYPGQQGQGYAAQAPMPHTRCSRRAMGNRSMAARLRRSVVRLPAKGRTARALRRAPVRRIRRRWPVRARTQGPIPSCAG